MTKIITVSSGRIELGNLSAGSYNYQTYSITVPDGYKTTDIAVVRKTHISGSGSALMIMVSMEGGKTGTVTNYYTYYAPVAVSSTNSDFTVAVLCEKI